MKRPSRPKNIQKVMNPSETNVGNSIGWAEVPSRPCLVSSSFKNIINVFDTIIVPRFIFLTYAALDNGEHGLHKTLLNGYWWLDTGDGFGWIQKQKFLSKEKIPFKATTSFFSEHFFITKPKGKIPVRINT